MVSGSPTVPRRRSRPIGVTANPARPVAAGNHVPLPRVGVTGAAHSRSSRACWSCLEVNGNAARACIHCRKDPRDNVAALEKSTTISTFVADLQLHDLALYAREITTRQAAISR